MNILIIGSGGREHALAWKIRQSPLVDKIFCAPGNPGIAELAECVPIEANNLDGLVQFAREKKIDLTVVGPEHPLTNGIVDLFVFEGLKIFGPSKVAAEIEGSKVFAKQFMEKYNIPTAAYRVFTAPQRYDAERYINEVPVPIVIKADGLAAGKGVTVCETKDRALEVLKMMMDDKAFGDAGSRVVIEEFLEGEELSILAITDGKEFVALSPVQDHKRIFDNDLGKNTGGMGAYAPAPVFTEQIFETIKHTIIKPALTGMAKEGRLYKGCLYIGLMITETGPKVIEFNCRFGDPETQVVLPLLEDDLVDLMLKSISGGLPVAVNVNDKSAVCVVVASGGYPDAYETGKEIFGLLVARSVRGVIIFHAGTAKRNDLLVTAGGRVLGITALGPADDLQISIDNAYRAVEKITFDGAYYRSDIGKKGIVRMRQLSAENM